ncbi:tRNA pseudouridine(13) synthase TruD [Gammaproteobacteria bacterium AS21]
MQPFLTQYQYLYSKPDNTSTIRASNEDFQVREIQAFEPDGEGEHWYLNILKNGENSDWVAKKIAIFFNVGSKEIGYAGKKDRHAITDQWFSVCLPGTKTIDLTGFDTDTIKVIAIKKHSRKLRTGALKGNNFSIVMRDVTNEEDFEKRLELIRQGVPNYFGEQRFGHGGGNISRGVSLLNGQFKEKNRTKKGLYISAVRSWFFNYLLSHRIENKLWNNVMLGDVVMLDGSHSHFSVDDVCAIQSRHDEQDLHLTGPMLGRGRSLVTENALEWEQKLLAPYEELIERLAYMGLSQERRAIRLIAANLSAQRLSAGVWQVSFDLPSGSFATSVLRELSDYSNAGTSNDTNINIK